MESVWEHKNKYLFISNCMFVDLCFLLLFLQLVKTRLCDRAINMSKPDVCFPELIFTLVQWQTYAQWISSKTLTRRRNYKTELFRETKIYNLLRSRFTYILNLSQVRAPCTKHIRENTLKFRSLRLN